MPQKCDPQLYKLLEVSWEAWNDSGIDVRALRDSNRVGVYTGICGSEVGLGPPISKLCTLTVAANQPAYVISLLYVNLLLLLVANAYNLDASWLAQQV